MDTKEVYRYNPNLFIWVTKKDLMGSLAKWAIKLSPYSYPSEITVVLDKFEENIEVYFKNEIKTVAIRKFKILELIDFLESNLNSIPVYMAWGERVNGSEWYKVITEWDCEEDPDDKFIDLGVLVRNIANDIYDTSPKFGEEIDSRLKI